MTTERNRTPAGVPAGGQFAIEMRGEADITLDGLGPDDLQDQARRSARFFVRRHGGDADEIEQQVILEYLTAIQRRSENPETSGRLITGDQEREHAYIHRMAGQISAKLVTPDLSRSEDRKANRMLRAMIDERVQQEGRELDDREIDEMADELRLGFEPRRRPTEGFHRRQFAPGSVDMLDEMSDHDACLAEDGSTVFDGDDDDGRFDGLEETAASGRKGKRDAQDRLWDTLVANSGAPAVAAQTLSEEKSAAHRKVVSKHRANRLVTAWRKGVIRPDQEGALFAPFGGPDALDLNEKSKICSTIEEAGRYGHDLWDAAIGGATRRRR